MKDKIRILVVNDDGYFAKGIHALAEALSGIGKVTVVAPDSQKSAVSHLLTITDSIRVREVPFSAGIKAYAVSGSPADCGKIAVTSLMKDNPPDLVASGINLGNNAGLNAIYSGTVAAAAEAAFAGLQAFAISLDAFSNPDFGPAADFAVKFAKYLVRNPLPKGILANINIPALPAEKIKGFKISEQSMLRYNEWYASRADIYGRRHYWLEGQYSAVNDGKADSDISALADGYISITPLHFDLTASKGIDILKKIIL